MNCKFVTIYLYWKILAYIRLGLTCLLLFWIYYTDLAAATMSSTSEKAFSELDPVVRMVTDGDPTLEEINNMRRKSRSQSLKGQLN